LFIGQRLEYDIGIDEIKSIKKSNNLTNAPALWLGLALCGLVTAFVVQQSKNLVDKGRLLIFSAGTLVTRD